MPTLRSGPKHEATLELQRFKNSKQLHLVGNFDDIMLLVFKSRITRIESGTHETSKQNSNLFYLFNYRQLTAAKLCTVKCVQQNYVRQNYVQQKCA